MEQCHDYELGTCTNHKAGGWIAKETVTGGCSAVMVIECKLVDRSVERVSVLVKGNVASLKYLEGSQSDC